jgi:hypothetical protein
MKERATRALQVSGASALVLVRPERSVQRDEQSFDVLRPRSVCWVGCCSDLPRQTRQLVDVTRIRADSQTIRRTVPGERGAQPIAGANDQGAFIRGGQAPSIKALALLPARSVALPSRRVTGGV